MAVWLFETVCQAILLASFMVIRHGNNADTTLGDVLALAFAILFIFTTTGYLLTTGILRAFWKNPQIWLYPFAATILFLIHFELFNITVDGAFKAPNRTPVLVAGLCITFVCTLGGGSVLRKWTR
jgi:hypothetical protein